MLRCLQDVGQYWQEMIPMAGAALVGELRP
jgi:hypothetical protein